MNKKLKNFLAIAVVLLFIGTTSSTALAISLPKTKDQNANNIEIESCDTQPLPADGPIPPGVYYQHFSPKGNTRGLYEWKHIQPGEEVTYKVGASFCKTGGNGIVVVVIDGKVYRVPNVATRMKIILDEKKDNGNWKTTDIQEIYLEEANEHYKYAVNFTVKYEEEGKYNIRARSVAYADASDGTEIYWSGSNTIDSLLITYVGNVKQKVKDVTPYIPDMKPGIYAFYIDNFLDAFKSTKFVGTKERVEFKVVINDCGYGGYTGTKAEYIELTCYDTNPDDNESEILWEEYIIGDGNSECDLYTFSASFAKSGVHKIKLVANVKLINNGSEYTQVRYVNVIVGLFGGKEKTMNIKTIFNNIISRFFC